MNNEHLFLKIKKLVTEEKRIGVEILECLYEIEIRKAYAELKYDGLYTYCIKELGFTDSQAYQRIQAMRALKEIPEIKPMIESGSLSVASVSKVQMHFREERKCGIQHSKEEKLEIFKLVENHTSKEAEKILTEMRGEKIKVKLMFELDEETESLWNQAKSTFAHSGCDLEIFKKVLKISLGHQKITLPKQEQQRAVLLLTRVQSAKTRYIPSVIKNEIYWRDKGKCQNCGGKYALQVDHIKPYATGGENKIENLRLLCRSCNLHAGIQKFGLQKMKRA